MEKTLLPWSSFGHQHRQKRCEARKGQGAPGIQQQQVNKCGRQLTICFTQCSTFLIWSSSQPPFCWEGSLSLFSFMIVLCMLGTCLLESMREREREKDTPKLWVGWLCIDVWFIWHATVNYVKSWHNALLMVQKSHSQPPFGCIKPL